MSGDNPNGGATDEVATFTFNDDGSFNLPDGTKVGSAKELGEGWMRQADYTRKTQDLAIQRKEVEVAENLMSQLQLNPAGTLKSLAANLGVDFGTPAPSSAPQRHSDDWGPEGWDDQPGPQGQGGFQDDPRIAQLLDAVDALQSQVGQVRGDAVRNSVQTELAAVQDKYVGMGVTVEPDILVRYATANGLNNLEHAATILYQDDIVAAKMAAAAREEGVVEQKRAASQAVTSGVGPAGEGPSPRKDQDGKMSLRDAMAAALTEHGISDLRDLSFESTARADY